MMPFQLQALLLHKYFEIPSTHPSYDPSQISVDIEFDPSRPPATITVVLPIEKKDLEEESGF